MSYVPQPMYLCSSNCNDSLFPRWKTVHDCLICCLHIIYTIISGLFAALGKIPLELSPVPFPLGCFPSLQLVRSERSACTLKNKSKFSLNLDVISYKSGRLSMIILPIHIFSLLVGVEVCKCVLDSAGENNLLQVHHLAQKGQKY